MKNTILFTLGVGVGLVGWLWFSYESSDFELQMQDIIEQIDSITKTLNHSRL